MITNLNNVSNVLSHNSKDQLLRPKHVVLVLTLKFMIQLFKLALSAQQPTHQAILPKQKHAVLVDQIKNTWKKHNHVLTFQHVNQMKFSKV